jgi:hypothetical protein
MNAIDRHNAGESSATPTADEWARFLKPLLFSVINPPAESDLPRKIGAIAFSLPAVRRHMLTTATQRDMLAKCKNWPSAAEVGEFFAENLRHEREMRAYRARPLLTVQERGEPTPQEIEYVRARAAEAKTHLRNIEEPPEMRKVKAAYLSPGQMLTVYERLAAEGNGAARLRVAAIRQQMERGA